MRFNKINLSINQLASTGLFLGYHTSIWNTSINYFLLGNFNRVNFLNLNYTYNLTKKFVGIISGLFVKKCSIWLIHEKFDFFNNSTQLVNASKQFKEIKFFNKKWCKGSISNYKKIKIVKRRTFPHAVIVPNIQNNHYAISECFIKSVPSFGFVDTLDNVKNIFFCIPGNSRSLRSLFYLYFITCKAAFYSRSIQTSSFISAYFLKANKIKSAYMAKRIWYNNSTVLAKFVFNFAQLYSVKKLLSLFTFKNKPKSSRKNLFRLRIKIVSLLLTSMLVNR